MRIDAYNQIAQLYGVQKSVGASKIQKKTSVESDQVSISRAGCDYQVAKNAVSEASDIREDKVAKIKSMMNAGAYSVSTSDFANKLMENYKSITC